MRNKMVTVFGGSGFIGRYVVRRLASQGARVRVPCRQPNLAMHLKPMGDVGQIVTERCDLARSEDLTPFVEGSDMVVSLVGILYERGEQSFDKLQAKAPGRIGEAAKAKGIERIVHVSAIGADPNAESAYARTKAAGEEALRAVFPEATILRPSIVFGPEDEFFNRFASMARFSPALPLIGGGHTRFQPVYVDDVAQAVLAGLSRPDTPGRTYELGGPQTYSFAELMRYLLKILRRRRLLLPLPFNIADFQARFLECLPQPPLTRDQVTQLKRDNVVGEDALTLADLDIQPMPLESIVPHYLERYARRTPKNA